MITLAEARKLGAVRADRPGVLSLYLRASGSYLPACLRPCGSASPVNPVQDGRSRAAARQRFPVAQ
jgi:hypothetical protein